MSTTITKNRLATRSGIHDDGTKFTVVENYSALPAPAAAVDKFYFVKTSQGTWWLPGSLGGTFYPEGTYYSDGISWTKRIMPYQATQVTVNTGIVTDQFVSPNTLANYTGFPEDFIQSVTDTATISLDVTINNLTADFIGDTDDVPEATNLYFTDERAQDAIGAEIDGTLVYVDATPLLTRAALTGDITAPQSSNITTLATVNGNVGTFGSATKSTTVTANGKGLITAISEQTVTPAAESVVVGALANGMAATTQTVNDNSTKIATTAYVDTYVEDFDIKIFKALGSEILAQTDFLHRVTTSFNMVSGRMTVTAIYVPRTMTLTGVKWMQVVSGVYTANNNNKIGLYTYSAGTLTLVASSTDDGTIWKAAANGVRNKAFSATYAASPGLYFIASLWSNSALTTTPSLGNVATSVTGANLGDFTNSGQLSAFIASQTDLPASQAMSGMTAYVNYPWMAVY